MEKFIESAFAYIKSILPNVFMAIIILVGGYFVTKLILNIKKKAMDKGKMDFSLEKFFINTIRIACYIILIISALSQLGISTTGILACFSAAVAAIALALKDSLSNIACGIILLFSKPFVTGDLIELGEYMGTVLQIDLIHTKILTFDNKGIMVPNSVISSKEVINFSHMPVRRVDVTIPVRYGSDLEKVKAVIKKAVLSIEKVKSDPEPFVRVNKLSESSVDFAVRAWTETDNYWDVYHDMLEKIMSALKEEDIVIPYNQLDVHLDKGPNITIK